MTTDELRAKFEASIPFLDFSLDSHGKYANERTRDHWRGYQAAHASRDAEVEALKKYGYTLTARLCAIGVVEEKDGYELIRRESVMRFVVEWRKAIDAAMRNGA